MNNAYEELSGKSEDGLLSHRSGNLKQVTEVTGGVASKIATTIKQTRRRCLVKILLVYLLLFQIFHMKKIDNITENLYSFRSLVGGTIGDSRASTNTTTGVGNIMRGEADLHLRFDDKAGSDMDPKFHDPATSPKAETSPTPPTGVYNDEDYQKALKETLKVLPDVQTASLSRPFFSGLNNQVHRFIGTILLSNTEKTGQIIEESIRWKDTFGTNKGVPHYRLWDVVHWNSFFPTLPRFASYDSEHHPHLQPHLRNTTIEGKVYSEIEVKHRKLDWDIWANKSITHPRPMGQFPQQNLNRYKQFTKKLDLGHKTEKDHLEMYSLILKDALRPHPFLQKIIKEEMSKLRGEEGGKFMTLHARVEPDMARQDRVCSVSRTIGQCSFICACQMGDQMEEVCRLNHMF